MRVPSSKLPGALVPGVYMLRSADFEHLLNPELLFTEAISMAIRGEIEGIATQAGRVKYLRMLDPEERRSEIVESEIIEEGGSSCFARTNLGAFKQPVREAVVAEAFDGHRSVVSSGDVVGHVWSHCGVRDSAS